MRVRPSRSGPLVVVGCGQPPGEVGAGCDDGLVTMEQPQLPGFQVHDLLGVGGQSSVWRATRLRDGTACALKVLASSTQRRGMSEAAALVRLRHEHLVGVLDVVALASSAGPTTALVLELADGGTLEALLAGRQLLTPGECVTVVAPVAQALAMLHRRGAVHGDLHPGNVLFRRNGAPVLSDLGATRLVGESPAGLGVPGWVAPEVMAGDAATPASDVFALGVLIWRVLTGAEPPTRVCPGDADGVLPTDIPVPVVELVEQACSWDPAQRPSAERVSRTLLEAVQPVRVRLRGLAQPSDDRAMLMTRRLRETALAPTQRPDGPEGLARRLRARRDGAATLRRAVGPADTPAGRSQDDPVADERVLVSAERNVGVRGRHRRARRSRARAFGGIAMVAGVVVIAGWSTAVLAPSLRGEGDLGPPGPSSPQVAPYPASPVAAGPSPTSGRPTAAASTLAGSAEASVATAVSELVVRRAGVWRGERTVGAVFAPGSPASQQEVRDLAALRETGARYERLSFVVVGPVQVTSLQQGRASVQLQIRRGGVLVRLPDGQAVTAVDRTDTCRAELVHTSDGWRFAELSSA